MLLFFFQTEILSKIFIKMIKTQNKNISKLLLNLQFFRKHFMNLFFIILCEFIIKI